MEKIKIYYYLAKPGIIYGNLLAAVAGFLFGAHGQVNGWELVAFAAGISGVMGAACVLNNIIDRGIDKKMTRTKNRALVTGDVSIAGAVVYAFVLGGVGFVVLAVYTNWLCVLLGAIALVLYVVAYGATKRMSVHGTLVGALPGAIPPVAGYVAATGRLDSAAWLVFAIMVAWQMPHFYAIAMYRKKEYAAAGLPVMTVKYGNLVTKKHMLGYIVLFIAAELALVATGGAGLVFASIMTLAGVVWLYQLYQGFKQKNDEKWAREMFWLSLKILLLFCLLLSVEAWLP